MSEFSLNKYTLTIAAGTVTAQAVGSGMLDWRYGGTQNRRVVITGANAADSFQLEGTLDGTNWFAAAAAQTGATSYVISLSGPYYALRITKTGANGAATVTAIV
jgi:hypothetical protein